MAAPDSNRHYYEHPSHRDRTMDVSEYYTNPLDIHSGNIGSNIGGSRPSSASEQMRPDLSDNPTDSFYRAKLRDGFVDLRNSYQRVNQRGGGQFTGSQNQIYSTPNHHQPRNPKPQADVTRPLSMHASAYPNKSYEHSLRDQEYGTGSSRGSRDSNYGVPAPQGVLFRSSSDLQLDNNNSTAFHDRPMRKDFGSADLVEHKQSASFTNSNDTEFFNILTSYKADGAVDQRAPAPPGMHNVLRGEADVHLSPTKPARSGHPPQLQVQVYQPRQSLLPQHSQHPSHSQHYQQPPPKPPHAHNIAQPHQQPYTAAVIPSANSSTPHQSLDAIKRSPKSNKKAQRPRSGDVSALLRKLRPTKGEGDSNARTTDSANDSQITNLLSEILPEERLRKKAFVHYDCQSVGINFVEAALKRQNTQMGNTKTGASAASHLDELGEEEVMSDSRRVSPLVGRCPAFINELGDEKERNIALTKVTAQTRQHKLTAGEDDSLLDTLRPPLCSGLSVLDGVPGADNRQSLVERHKGYILEYRDRGCTYYRQHFRHEEHQNYFGFDENVGPVAISIRREKVSPKTRLPDSLIRHNGESHDGKSQSEATSPLQQYRVIARTSELKVLRGIILEESLPSAARLSNSSRGLPAKDIIEYVIPEIQLSCLRQATNSDKTKEQVQALDEQRRSNTYKVGVMYCKAGQSTEEEIYNNEHSSPAFTSFLDLIGRKVKLKGFEQFKGGLDTKTDTTGAYSYYVSEQAHEIMFHVSTLLPIENNRQQLLRKRHIGNDIVTVVFQEPGSLPFDVTSMRSKFQHVFIIVRVHHPNTENTKYSVAVTRSKGVPSFGPPIAHSFYAHNQEFADFIIAKILNAENASHQSDKFQAMAARTRGEYLKDLATNYVTNNSLDHSSKLGKFSLGGGKKKDKKTGKLVPDILAPGGLVWPVQLEDSSLCTYVEVYIVISADVIAAVEMDTSDVIFSCWCSSVIGWTNLFNSTDPTSTPSTGLRIYFNQGEVILIKPIDNDDTLEIVDRLRVVTHGCETREMNLKRNEHGQLGFHVHMDGIVSEVEPQGPAWDSGVRTGSRLVEICKVAMVTLTHEQMIDLLRTSSSVTVSMIPPLDGKPRRGLEDKSSEYYMIYPTDEHRSRANNSNIHQNPVDGEESSAYFSDDETSPQSTVMSVAKRINTVTLRSSSSGGSSCSPGSTLSSKHQRADRRAQSDTEGHHGNRQHIHNRAKSQDQQQHGDTNSVSQRRPPAGPIYTVPHTQYGSGGSNPATASAGSYYQAGHLHPPPNESRQRQTNGQPRPSSSSSNSSRRAAKDWRHVEPPRLTNQHLGYSERAGERLNNSGSQEVLNKMPASVPNHYSKPAAHYASPNNYAQLDGPYFNRKLQRTFSDESLQSPSRRVNSPSSAYRDQLRRVPQELVGVTRSRTGSIPLDPGANSVHIDDEDLDWNKLVNTASKAIESGTSTSANHYVTLVPWKSEPSSASRSHDSSTDKDNSSLLSGNSTPTQDKTKELEVRCSRLEHDLYMEKRKCKDLERRLQLEKNRNGDLLRDISELKKENSSLRCQLP